MEMKVKHDIEEEMETTCSYIHDLIAMCPPYPYFGERKNILVYQNEA